MLKDEGNTVDPISGNQVPPGAMQEEVRDDVPAQLSEGEFVFPADVVRYWGLSTLMQMRQEAKQGLSQMEAMGQMGNSEEAVIPDDVEQFPIPDVNIDELMQQQQPQQQMVAKGGDIKKFKEGGDVSYEDVMGTSPFEIPALSSVPTAYINKKTGQIIYLPHDAEGNLMIGGGKPPAGYELASEADLEDTPEEVQTPQVQQVQKEDNPDRLGNNPEYGGGGAKIGGEMYTVKYGKDGEVFLANEKADKAAGFSSPQWLKLDENQAGVLGFTDKNAQGVSKDSLIMEASFGNSAGGWLGNPDRETKKKEAQNTISGFQTARNNVSGDIVKMYTKNLKTNADNRKATDEKYFGGINKVLNSVGDLVSKVANPASLVAQKVAGSTGNNQSNDNSQNNDTSQNNNTGNGSLFKNMSGEEKRDYSRTNIEAAAARQKSQQRNDGKFGDDLKDKPEIYAGGGRHGGFKEGGLASKKKKYSKGGKAKKSKRGLATQLELGI